MNDTPTSGPMSTSITQKEREVMSSRHSFFRSHFEPLREGKKPPVKRGGQRGAGALRRRCGGRVECSCGDDPPAAQKHETVADFRRIGDLVDRQEEGAVGGKMLAQRCCRV